MLNSGPSDSDAKASSRAPASVDAALVRSLGAAKSLGSRARGVEQRETRASKFGHIQQPPGAKRAADMLPPLQQTTDAARTMRDGVRSHLPLHRGGTAPSPAQSSRRRLDCTKSCRTISADLNFTNLNPSGPGTAESSGARRRRGSALTRRTEACSRRKGEARRAAAATAARYESWLLAPGS